MPLHISWGVDGRSLTGPPTVAMALGGDKGAEWAASMEAELDPLWENEVYEEVPRY